MIATDIFANGIDRRTFLTAGIALGALAGSTTFSRTGALAAPMTTATDTTTDFKTLSAADWQKRLSPEQFYVLRKHGTERAGTSPLNKEKRAGTFACAGCDLALFDAGTNIDQLWFRRVSNSLEVSIIGTADRLTVSGWYSGDQYHLEQFKTSDGRTLLDSQVNNLVNAMAAFAPPAMGQTSLSAALAEQLSPVLAANWH